jgi:hypothetical protein
MPISAATSATVVPGSAAWISSAKLPGSYHRGEDSSGLAAGPAQRIASRAIHASSSPRARAGPKATVTFVPSTTKLVLSSITTVSPVLRSTSST